MALETATYINGLVATNPTSTDNVGDGDNHIRLLKSSIKATFPNLSGAVSGTHTAINSAVVTANSATNANTASAVVKRDASGNFSAGTVSAALTGNVTGNVTGNLTGDVSGNVTGNVTGNLTGNVTGNVTGNANTSSRWATARTITLGGDLTGSVSVRGDANATLTAQVSNNSHAHTIANVTGLQTALNGKVDNSQVLTNVPSGAVFTDTNTDTTYSAGSGMSLNGTQFVNASPDRVVSISGSGATSVSGSYPNFTISSTDTNTVYSHPSSHSMSMITGLTSALAGKLSTSGTAANSTKWNTYKLSTSATGASSDTIYFRT
jgi:hypothetical protein